MELGLQCSGGRSSMLFAMLAIASSIACTIYTVIHSFYIVILVRTAPAPNAYSVEAVRGLQPTTF